MGTFYDKISFLKRDFLFLIFIPKPAILSIFILTNFFVKSFLHTETSIFTPFYYISCAENCNVWAECLHFFRLPERPAGPACCHLINSPLIKKTTIVKLSKKLNYFNIYNDLSLTKSTVFFHYGRSELGSQEWRPRQSQRVVVWKRA